MMGHDASAIDNSLPQRRAAQRATDPRAPTQPASIETMRSSRPICRITLLWLPKHTIGLQVTTVPHEAWAYQRCTRTRAQARRVSPGPAPEQLNDDEHEEDSGAEADVGGRAEGQFDVAVAAAGGHNLGCIAGRRLPRCRVEELGRHAGGGVGVSAGPAEREHRCNMSPSQPMARFVEGCILALGATATRQGSFLQIIPGFAVRHRTARCSAISAYSVGRIAQLLVQRDAPKRLCWETSDILRAESTACMRIYTSRLIFTSRLALNIEEVDVTRLRDVSCDG